MNLSGHRVYLDANTVIYAVEGLPGFASLKAGLLVPLDAGAFVAVTSELTLIETITGPRKAGKPNDEAAFRKFLTPSASLIMPPLTLPTIEKVIELRAQFGFKTPDAIHLATGILAGCDLFVTGDNAWSRAGATVVDSADIG